MTLPSSTFKLFGIEHVVEMGVPRVHAGRAARLNLLLGQLGGREAAAAFLEALELP